MSTDNLTRTNKDNLPDVTRNTCKQILALDPFIYPEDPNSFEECNDGIKAFSLEAKLAELEGYPVDFREEHGFHYYFYSTFTVDENHNDWRWLFSAAWPNDLDQAKRRAAYLLKHINPPEDLIGNPGIDFYESELPKIYEVPN